MSKAIGMSLAINAFFLLLCAIFGNLAYGAIDDYFMAGILTGIYGDDYNVHMTFVNAIYGYVLMPFYLFFPKIGWYYIGEIASVFLSLAVICSVIIRRIGVQWGLVFSILFVATFARDFYLVAQFTQCAYALTAAGFLLLMYSLYQELSCKRNVIIVLGLFFLLWGSLMRWESFLMGLPFMALFLAMNAKVIWKKRFFVFFAGTVLVLGSFGLEHFNKSLYNSPEYGAYMEFQKKRAIIGDGQFYNDMAIDEDLEESGHSRFDYAMLKNWVFYDKQVFSPESLDYIVSLIKENENKINYHYIPGIALDRLLRFSQFPSLWIWAFFAIVAVFFKKNKVLYIWGLLILVVSLMTYLKILGRPVFRVENGFWFYATVFVIPYLPTLSKRIKLVWAIIIVMGGVAFYDYYVSGSMVRNPNNGIVATLKEKENTETYKNIWKYVEQAPDSVLFFTEMSVYMELSRHRNPPYLSEPMGSWKKIIPLGFWLPYFPDVETVLQSHNIDNPLKDVVKDNVYVLGSLTLLPYLKQHYYEGIKKEEIRDFNGIPLVKYVLTDGENNP